MFLAFFFMFVLCCSPKSKAKQKLLEGRKKKNLVFFLK